ncbi:hypothetical protein F8388_015956 [Cannabis sativa]|uniref:phosphoserine phosphatase n=1 Tax=Cannabis sativa TaxID=3483 RepID=A0A7J6EH31_CANSA|nr:hypothetical protein F8388_015956 [Cannabis sativa]
MVISCSTIHGFLPQSSLNDFFRVLKLWRNANAVCFDVDSTVCVDEGIDELAEFCGAGKAVAEWTARAMSGSVPSKRPWLRDFPPVASMLAIPPVNIFANQLLFGSSGEFLGFDKQRGKPGGADLFVCYAGVQHRAAVAANADWLVFDFKDLISCLD